MHITKDKLSATITLKFTLLNEKQKSYKNLLMSTAAEHQLAGELSTGNTSIF